MPLLALETIHGAHRHLQAGQGHALEQPSDDGRLVIEDRVSKGGINCSQQMAWVKHAKPAIRSLEGCVSAWHGGAC